MEVLITVNVFNVLECVVTIENPTLCVIDKYKGKKTKKRKKELPLRNQDVIVVKPV